MMTPVTVHGLFRDSADDSAPWEPTRYTYTDWLDAAHAVSSLGHPNIINTRYVRCETADMDGFQAYCSRLMPRGVKV